MSWNSFCYLFGTKQNLSFHYCFSAEFAAAALYLILAAHFPTRKKKKRRKEKEESATYFCLIIYFLVVVNVTKIFSTFGLNSLTLYLPHPNTFYKIFPI